MSCKTDFGNFKIRTLTNGEKQMIMSQLVRSLQNDGFRLASTKELRGPVSKYVRNYYPIKFCILAAFKDGSTTRPCLWNPAYEQLIFHSGILSAEVTDVAIARLDG